MARLSLNNISKIYPNGYEAIKNINLDIKDGEFFALLGPSGCGKSTILRLISGLEDLTSGEIWMDDENISDFEPKDRKIAMVFQNYALYPHMNVYENIAFSLRLEKLKSEEIDRKVKEVMRATEIEEISNRKPNEISGGQRQRVALARALIKNPNIFLFDEPLSNLDTQLRFDMRIKIIDLHKYLKRNNKNSTMVFVTHDQVEAMTMADRIGIMDKGKIVQIATPIEMYEKPLNKFIAEFIGSPSMNFIKAKVFKEKKEFYLDLFGYNLEIKKNLTKYIGKEVIVGIRPENIYRIKGKDKNNKNFIKSKIEIIENMGNEKFIHFKLKENHIIARISNIDSTDIEIDKSYNFSFDTERLYFFDNETKENIFK